jgi:hypothetical protein
MATGPAAGQSVPPGKPEGLQATAARQTWTPSGVTSGLPGSKSAFQAAGAPSVTGCLSTCQVSVYLSASSLPSPLPRINRIRLPILSISLREVVVPSQRYRPPPSTPHIPSQYRSRRACACVTRPCHGVQPHNPRTRAPCHWHYICERARMLALTVCGTAPRVCAHFRWRAYSLHRMPPHSAALLVYDTCTMYDAVSGARA